MKHLYLSIAGLFMLLLSGCNSEEASHIDRVSSSFSDSLGVDISSSQWWKTTVRLRIKLTTDRPVKLVLLSSETSVKWLYDYKEVESSGVVTMTAPQGQGNTLTLGYLCSGKYKTMDVTLSGASEENITINTTTSSRSMQASARRRYAPPASLCGSSIAGNAKYYEFTYDQLQDYYEMMQFSSSNRDAKEQGLNCNYELQSNGPFYITWVNGYEAEQSSHILGYYYHSASTWEDITYVDLSETHKWDYIDGLSKVQYQVSRDDLWGGYYFKAYTWYDANFEIFDYPGSTQHKNPDRNNDNAFNSQAVYGHFGRDVCALRGISFLVNVPEGMRIGFYLRSDEEPLPQQWLLLNNQGIPPHFDRSNFKGTCFCVEKMNVVGNGRGLHRSFIEECDSVIWMGMEDLVEGGDHDCNDVIFGVVQHPAIMSPLPTIIDPDKLDVEEKIEDILSGTVPFPWTIAYEDVNRITDFDFNDAVIKVVPDYANEECCVWVMAAGSTSRMYLHFDGPDGDENLGEIHELLGSKKTDTCINTERMVANTGFVQIDCVPWPKEYTIGQDAKRFYIEIQRGTCEDCTDIITLADDPGRLPEALLVAGEWQWPLEGKHINSVYEDFSKWAHDPTRTRYWEWYTTPEYSSSVVY